MIYYLNSIVYIPIRLITNEYLSTVKMFNNQVIDYPAVTTLSYTFGVGSLMILCQVLRITSDLFLLFHYLPSIKLTFNNSVEYTITYIRYTSYGKLLFIDNLFLFMNLFF